MCGSREGSPARLDAVLDSRSREPKLAAVQMVWHYRNWRRLPEIIASRCLLPTDTNFAAGLPLFWFTANRICDPTSADGVFGSVRFGLRADDVRVLPWWHVFVSAGADPAEFIATLELTGAARDEWYAIAEPVPLDELMFEVLRDGAGDWACSLGDDGLAWQPADLAATERAYFAAEEWARA